MEVSINKKTKLLVVLGAPITHSLSPAIHNRWIRQLGENILYLPIKCTSKELKNIFNALKDISCLGINLTVPLKEEILQWMDELSPEANYIGAVNTVTFKNKLAFGYNTDAKGYGEALAFEANFEAKGKTVMILGAGGAAKACVYQLAKSRAARIFICNRTEEKAVAIKKKIQKLFKETDIEVCAFRESEIKSFIARVDLLINATSMGWVKNPDSASMTFPLPWRDFPDDLILSDLLYPMERSVFFKEAKRALPESRYFDGLEMLIRQAGESFFLWTGKRPDIDEVRAWLRPSIA